MCGGGRRRVFVPRLDRGGRFQAESPPASTRTRGRPAFISTRAAAMADSSSGQSQKTTSSRPSERRPSRAGSCVERDADGAGNGAHVQRARLGGTHVDQRRAGGPAASGLAQRVDLDVLDVVGAQRDAALAGSARRRRAASSQHADDRQP